MRFHVPSIQRLADSTNRNKTAVGRRGRDLETRPRLSTPRKIAGEGGRGVHQISELAQKGLILPAGFQGDSHRTAREYG